MAEVSTSRLLVCEACPRLVALRAEVRARHPDYHAAPVPAWGRRDARLLIVGLAPGMHGANRTGRPFTGDASGVFLFAGLHRAGFATAARAEQARLIGTRITNAVKCLPPGNRPIASEIAHCGVYLAAEIATLRGHRPRRPRAILCLGRLAHEAVARVLPERVPDFEHGALTAVAANVFLADTYHPSRQNTQTGRLTTPMLDAVLRRVRRCLDGG
ncbi:MAG: uracil-DNA glycosylase [Pseudomonadales bacterium]|jgi:uracil-DNA glycosylase family 4